MPICLSLPIYRVIGGNHDALGGIIELIGGSLNMEAFCTIAGAGDLVVKAGEHNLAFSIDAHITISNVSENASCLRPILFYSNLRWVALGVANLAFQSWSCPNHQI